MKLTNFALMSDVHLEFGERNFELPAADVLLLAGDICLVSDLSESMCGTLIGERTVRFLKDVSKKYKQVIWIPGNHEYYGGDIKSTVEKVNQFLIDESITNIEFNDHGTFTTADHVKVVYATLWTDMKKSCPLVLNAAAGYMNDYNNITFISGIKHRLLCPADTVAIHAKHKRFIQQECTNTQDKLVVMTHHAPLMTLLNKKTNPSEIDYCYGSTDMEDIILDNDIKVWAYGHVHTRNETAVADTKFISNCRGYLGHEPAASSFLVKTFTV